MNIGRALGGIPDGSVELSCLKNIESLRHWHLCHLVGVKEDIRLVYSDNAVTELAEFLVPVFIGWHFLEITSRIFYEVSFHTKGTEKHRYWIETFIVALSVDGEVTIDDHSFIKFPDDVFHHGVGLALTEPTTVAIYSMFYIELLHGLFFTETEVFVTGDRQLFTRCHGVFGTIQSIGSKLYCSTYSPEKSGENDNDGDDGEEENKTE